MVRSAQALQKDVFGAPATGGLAAYILLLTVGILLVGGFIASDVWSLYQTRAGAEDVRIPVLKSAVRANPSDANIRRELAVVYQQTGNERAALAEFRKVLAIRARDSGALYGAGIASLARGDEDEAEEYFLRLLAIDPTHARASVQLGRIHMGNQETQKALAVVKRAAQAHPDDAELRYLTGLCLERTGDVAGALEQYRQALAFVPNMPGARKALLRLGALDE